MVFKRVRRGSQGIHRVHTLFRFDLQAVAIAADMSDVESVLILIDVKVMPFFLVWKQNIPNAVQNGQLVGELIQLFH